ncbi:MAG TPA: DUF805 domain-containing protein, partial [Rhizomicrobium sp.]|nr:DUF805 domain-containing protein [Rhizomicrobium sp.]
GRARRAAFWYFVLANFIVGVLLGVIEQSAHMGQMLSSIYSVLVFLPTLAVTVRRLHDTGRSGWWVLLAAIPLVGWAVLIYWYCVEGTHGPNEYGPDPKAAQAPA